MRSGERGAVLVHVAVALAGLLAFSALTIDLGVLWVARAQAQNAADAAALAAAVSLAYVHPEDGDVAVSAATEAVTANRVWGEVMGASQISSSVGACPPGAPDVPGTCVGVQVSRGGSAGLPLPTYFAPLFGIGSQAVTASAYAKVLTGNSSDCLRPIAIADRWIERYPTAQPWTLDDQFQRYADAGTIPPADADEYQAPSQSSSGSGFTVDDMHGARVQVTRPPNFHGGVLVARHYVQLDLPRAAGPAGDEEQQYRANLLSCNGLPVSIGTWQDAYDNHYDATNESIEALIARDPGATWDPVTGTVRSDFAPSPRVLTVAVFDPDAYAQAPRPNLRISVHIRNLIGLFVERVDGSGQITGVLMRHAGTFNPAAEQVTDNAAFLRTVALVR